jgi:hypothetical protein
VTSKLQVTIPKALADEYGIVPGCDIVWSASGDAIRLSRTARRNERGARGKLRLFDNATLRQREREKSHKLPRGRSGRGWTREELYQRGRSR